jgi:trimeric autotransporter adhesin
MATLTGKKINTTYDGLLKTEDNQPISTTKKKVTDGYGNETGLSVDSLGNVDVSDDLSVLGNASVAGSTTANSFIKTGGTSAQFLKADGSLDSNTYITTSTDTLDSVTDRGNSTTNSITVNGINATTAIVDSLEIQFGLRDQTNSLGTSGQILTSTGTATDWKSTSELGLIDGSGTANKLPKFTDADTIGNSTITDTGTKIGVNNANPTYSLDVYRNEATNILRLQNNTFSSWFGSDATGFSIETNLFKPITFKPSGVTAMTLDSSGNVTVNNNLSIGGTLIDSSSSSGTSGQVLSSTGTGTDWVDLSEISGVDGSGTANYIAKWTDGDTIGNSVIYDNGTNVGIGTGVPTEKIQVVGNGLFTGNVGLGVAPLTAIGNKRLTIYEASNTSLVLSNSNNFVNIFNGSTVGDPTSIFSNTGFKFATASDASATGFSEKMRIHSTGDISFRDTSANEAFYWDASTARLGLGTTNPTTKLDVVGTYRMQLRTDDTIPELRATTANGAAFKELGLNGSQLVFNTSSTERMRITSAGAIHLSQGTGNAYVGTDAGNLGTSTGIYNTGFGLNALANNTSGSNNLANGTNALISNTTGGNNTAVGTFALLDNTTGTNNSAFGVSSLQNNTTGTQNTANGYNALKNNTTGNNNTANGFQTLEFNTTGASNTANGFQVLKFNTTASNNTATGYRAMYSNTTGSENVANGYQALYSNTTGSSNTANGKESLFLNTTGTNNTANGSLALYYNTTGIANTGIGSYGLLANTTGSGNIGIGGRNSSGSYNPVFVITTQNDYISMGTSNVTNAYIKVAWTVTSDARDKTEIKEVPHGLDFVSKLEPISYKFKESRDSDVSVGDVKYGFKAQDILALEGDNSVIIDTKDEDTLRYNESSLIPVLVNAIKELKAEIELLKNK